MESMYSLTELLFYLVLYAFIGWVLEVCFIAVLERRFSNRGLLNLPFKVSFGVTMTILLLTLPSLDGNVPLQILMCVAVTEVVRRFSELFSRGVGDARMKQELVGRGRITARLVLLVLMASVYELFYLIIHPVIHGLTLFLPDFLIGIIAIAALVLFIADFICVRYALHSAQSRQMEESTQELGNRMVSAIWRRLERAYPGADKPQDLMDGSHVFARGLCMDKLVWVFLISSFLGAMIEMAYCYLIGGRLMSRSSVLYGPFSVVWGFGAVILTVTLQRFSGREDRYTFLAGFVIGGAYEFLCSVLSELVFGTVFWDYSQMKLSIGGRTNVVYCVFWGILAVVWVKILYPLMSRQIEKIPPLAGKILTWSIVVVMACNALLTCAAMIRYTERHTDDARGGKIRALLDENFGDEYMESRWPNMKLVE